MLSAYTIPIVVFAFVLATFSIMVTIARNYHKVSPNQVAVVSGRTYKSADGKKRGYRVVTGGGFFKWPILEKVEYIGLNLMTLEVRVENAPDKNGALVSVQGISNVKILSDDASLGLAIERFLGRSEEQIKAAAKENLEGNLRAIVGTMTIEELINDRSTLQEKILKEAVSDLAKLGLGVDLLTVQEIRDNRGYIESLGKKRTAEVVRDAAIGEAQAKRDASIGQAEAQRDADIKSADAKQRGEVAKAIADQNVSEASRNRDVAIAENKAKVDAQRARIEIVANIAAAEEKKKLNVANVDAEQARVEAETRLQDAERKRHEAELQAGQIVKAEKDREAKIILAEADQKAKIIAAEADKEAASRTGEAKRILSEKEGLGDQAKLTAQAVGRKAAAEALQAEKEAEAAGKKAGLLADAEGNRASLLAKAEGEKATLLARAEGERALLLAQAEGTLKKAQAFRELDEAGRFLLILEALPPVIGSIGTALEGFMVPAARAIGQGLGNVKELRLVDLGGGNGNGENILSQFAHTPVETIFGILEKLRDTGLLPVITEAAKRVGVDLSNIVPVTTALAPTTQSSPELPPPPTKDKKV